MPHPSALSATQSVTSTTILPAPPLMCQTEPASGFPESSSFLHTTVPLGLLTICPRSLTSRILGLPPVLRGSSLALRPPTLTEGKTQVAVENLS